MTEIAITKEAAAQRQIDAAVRMLFLHGEDLIAIHTVAAAARNLLKDLADRRGVDVDVEKRSAVSTILNIRSGRDRFGLNDQAVINYLSWMEDDKRTHQFRNKAANFLKHADKDPANHVDGSELDTVWLLV
jgi:hypothetical protein